MTAAELLHELVMNSLFLPAHVIQRDMKDIKPGQLFLSLSDDKKSKLSELISGYTVRDDLVSDLCLWAQQQSLEQIRQRLKRK